MRQDAGLGPRDINGTVLDYGTDPFPQGAVVGSARPGQDAGQGADDAELHRLSGGSIEKAIFIPPAPDVLPAALKDLEGFCDTTQRDTIVQTALVHAQFELLHPFLDGNGRVGRILIPLMLFSKGLISRPTFYISEYFEENRLQYYRRLAAISEEQDWQGWSEFFLTAVSEQAELNARRAGAMLRLYNDMKDVINRVTRSQHALETLDALFASPFMTKSDFVKRTKIATRSAERLLPQLEAAGILTIAEPGSGSRPTVFVFKRLLAITEQREGF
jgi:Fic family protein